MVVMLQPVLAKKVNKSASDVDVDDRHCLLQVEPVKLPPTSLPPSPTDALPNEILGHIFHQYIDEMPMKRYPDISASLITTVALGTLGPIILGQICSRWRAASISMPTLWSSLAIYRPKMSHIPLVRLWLGRSDACPLNLSLTRAIEDDEIQDAPIQQILALFISSSRRWKSIRLSLDGIPGPQLLKLLDLPRGSTPILESADLSLPDWNSTDVDKLWTILYRSPTLRRITWGPEYHFSSSTPPAHVPWTRLTHMNLGNLFGFKLTIDEFINTLRPCQELLELIVSIDWPETGNLRAKPMILPKLRTCEVDAWRYNSAVFLNRVVCPRLVSLHLMHGMGRQDIGQPKSCSYIEEFLLRSACDLKTFSISDTTTAITEEDLGNLFKSPSMQSLQDMSLRMKVLTDQTVKLLIRPAGRSKPCVLPKLSALSMTSDSQCQTVDGLIFEMVTSRLPILRTIQVMNIFGRPASHDLMHLRALKNKQHPAYEMLRVLPEP